MHSEESAIKVAVSVVVVMKMSVIDAAEKGVFFWT